MSPNYKKGGGDVACCAATSSERSAKAGTRARRELPCLAGQRPRRVGENKRNKRRNRRGSRGALLRREPLSIDQHSTAGADEAKDQPKQGS